MQDLADFIIPPIRIAGLHSLVLISVTPPYMAVLRKWTLGNYREV